MTDDPKPQAGFVELSEPAPVHRSVEDGETLKPYHVVFRHCPLADVVPRAFEGWAADEAEAVDAACEWLADLYPDYRVAIQANRALFTATEITE